MKNKPNSYKILNLNNELENSLVVPPNYYTIFKADSGASKTFVKETDAHILQNIETTTGLSVALPDLSTLTSSKKGILPIPGLSETAKTAHILPGLCSASLLSLGQLCDDGCEIVLSKNNIIINKNNITITTGKRNKQDGLWDVPFKTKQHTPTVPNKSYSINIILKQNMAKKNLIKFLHAACFSPTKSTFLKAIKNGNLDGWPGLTVTSVNKHLDTIEATEKGHMKMERQGLQSTKGASKHNNHPLYVSVDDHWPHNTNKTNDVLYKIVEYDSAGKAYGDLTGAFPYVSARGSRYFLVAYCWDANAILVELLKSRTAGDIAKAYNNIINLLNKHGAKPNTFILDNECSKELTNTFEKHNISYQQVPPKNKRRNAAERAIQTWKDHFIAGLSSVDPEYPIVEWDRLVFQGVLTLNLLRNARCNQHLSAWAYLFGNFNFNKTPLAPPGIKVMIHTKIEGRQSWGPRSEPGFYTGPALTHYRCIKALKNDTKREIITDTVKYIPHKIPVPATSLNDYLDQAVSDILDILQNPPDNLPSIQAGCKTKQAVRDVAIALRQAVAVPKSPQPQTLTQHRKKMIKWASPLNTTIPKKNMFSHDNLLRNNTTTKYTASDMLNGDAPTRVRQNKSTLGRPRINRFTNATPFRKIATQVLQQLSILTDTPTKRPYKLSLHNPFIHHIYNTTNGKKETIDSLRQGKDNIIWENSLSNEWGRLANGTLKNPNGGSNTIEFVMHHDVPSNRDITYASFVCDYRPLKEDPYRVRIVVGGDRLSYNDDAGSPAASLIETKLIINSTISDNRRGARFFTADIKDYFLATPMSRPEYMKVHIKHFPKDIVEKYNLNNKVSKDGYIYIQIKKGMYGLKQAAVLAYNQLVSKLKIHGYFPSPHTNGIWEHKTRKTRFCLCVDDFGIKSYSHDDTQHLINALKSNYTISVDMSGTHYCGLTLDWNYQENHVDISMPGYITKLLHKLQHQIKKSPQYTPYIWNPPKFGTKRQYAQEASKLPVLDKKDIKYVQTVVGSLLYYSRAIDPTMLTALNEIATVQSKPTSDTLTKCQVLLDYAATYPNTKQRFHQSDMILHVDSDASYLVQPGAKSRIAGSYVLSSLPTHGTVSYTRAHNTPFLIECRTLRHVVASSAEAETGALFQNAQNSIAIRQALHSLGHPQPATPLKTDNSTAFGYVHNNIKQRKSKSWDMRYHWLRDKELQKFLKIFWHQGCENDADYFTKHFPAKYHRNIRKRYVLNMVQDKPHFVRTTCKGVLREINLTLRNQVQTDKPNGDVRVKTALNRIIHQ